MTSDATETLNFKSLDPLLTYDKKKDGVWICDPINGEGQVYIPRKIVIEMLSVLAEEGND
jgi:hypothetical protein